MRNIKNKPPQALVDQIICLYNKGQLEQTVALAENIAYQYSSSPTLYEIIAAAYMGLGNASKTIKNYQKVLRLNPNNTDAYNNIGIIFYNQGEFEKSIESYQKALVIEPNFADAHYNLGNSFRKTGNLTKAAESYKTSLAINPNDAEVLNNYGSTLNDYGKFDKAIECYVKALKIKPEVVDKKAYALIGAKELERGNSAEGIRYYKKSIEISQENEIPNLLSLFLKRLKYIKDMNFFLKVVSEITDIVLGEIQNPQFYKYAHNFLSLVVFSKNNSKEQMDILFDFWAAPWINHAFDCGEINFALYLENILYDDYTKITETEEHFSRSTSIITDAAARAGHRIRIKFPTQSTIREDKIRKIGFFIHNASTLAHIEVLFEFLKTANKDTTPDFKAFIFCFNGQNKEMSEKFASINIEIIRLDLNATGETINNWLDRYLRLRSVSHDMNIHTIVWISLVLHMSFVFSMRIAPHQVWWSLKWANFSAPGIDKRLASFSFKECEVYHNQKFLSARMQFSDLLAPASKYSVRKIRNLYEGKLILGTLGRSEKIKDPSFLEAVSKILKHNENTIFMWTGRSENSFIKLFFEEAGVASQVEFIGWVDTQVYSHVFDIHLDSFPFGNGVTALQSMAAGTPVVLHKSMMASFSDMDKLIRPLFEDSNVGTVYKKKAFNIFFDNNNQESLYLSAPDIPAYIEMVQRLINDEPYRKIVGQAYRSFIKEMMSNPAETSEIMTRHLLN